MKTSSLSAVELAAVAHVLTEKPPVQDSQAIRIGKSVLSNSKNWTYQFCVSRGWNKWAGRLAERRGKQVISKANIGIAQVILGSMKRKEVDALLSSKSIPKGEILVGVGREQEVERAHRGYQFFQARTNPNLWIHDRLGANGSAESFEEFWSLNKKSPLFETNDYMQLLENPEATYPAACKLTDRFRGEIGLLNLSNDDFSLIHTSLSYYNSLKQSLQLDLDDTAELAHGLVVANLDSKIEAEYGVIKESSAFRSFVLTRPRRELDTFVGAQSEKQFELWKTAFNRQAGETYREALKEELGPVLGKMIGDSLQGIFQDHPKKVPYISVKVEEIRSLLEKGEASGLKAGWLQEIEGVAPGEAGPALQALVDKWDGELKDHTLKKNVEQINDKFGPLGKYVTKYCEREEPELFTGEATWEGSSFAKFELPAQIPFLIKDILSDHQKLTPQIVQDVLTKHRSDGLARLKILNAIAEQCGEIPPERLESILLKFQEALPGLQQADQAKMVKLFHMGESIAKKYNRLPSATDNPYDIVDEGLKKILGELSRLPKGVNLELRLKHHCVVFWAEPWGFPQNWLGRADDYLPSQKVGEQVLKELGEIQKKLKRFGFFRPGERPLVESALRSTLADFSSDQVKKTGISSRFEPYHLFAWAKQMGYPKELNIGFGRSAALAKKFKELRSNGDKLHLFSPEIVAAAQTKVLQMESVTPKSLEAECLIGWARANGFKETLPATGKERGATLSVLNHMAKAAAETDVSPQLLEASLQGPFVMMQAVKAGQIKGASPASVKQIKQLFQLHLKQNSCIAQAQAEGLDVPDLPPLTNLDSAELIGARRALIYDQVEQLDRLQKAGRLRYSAPVVRAAAEATAKKIVKVPIKGLNPKKNLQAAFELSCQTLGQSRMPENFQPTISGAIDVLLDHPDLGVPEFIRGFVGTLLPKDQTLEHLDGFLGEVESQLRAQGNVQNMLSEDLGRQLTAARLFLPRLGGIGATKPEALEMVKAKIVSEITPAKPAGQAIVKVFLGMIEEARKDYQTHIKGSKKPHELPDGLEVSYASEWLLEDLPLVLELLDPKTTKGKLVKFATGGSLRRKAVMHIGVPGMATN